MSNKAGGTGGPGPRLAKKRRASSCIMGEGMGPPPPRRGGIIGEGMSPLGPDKAMDCCVMYISSVGMNRGGDRPPWGRERRKKVSRK